MIQNKEVSMRKSWLKAIKIQKDQTEAEKMWMGKNPEGKYEIYPVPELDSVTVRRKRKKKVWRDTVIQELKEEKKERRVKKWHLIVEKQDDLNVYMNIGTRRKPVWEKLPIQQIVFEFEEESVAISFHCPDHLICQTVTFRKKQKGRQEIKIEKGDRKLRIVGEILTHKLSRFCVEFVFLAKYTKKMISFLHSFCDALVYFEFWPEG